MNVLAVDTSGKSVGVALLREDKALFEAAFESPNTHSQTLMPLVEQALTCAGLPLSAVDLFACVVGPGSFTGVRIGVSTVKGLCQALQKPCVAVNALEALAAGIFSFAGVICPILDARAGQVYGAAFAAGNPPKRLLADVALKLEDYLAALPNENCLFLGDGALVFADRIRQILGDRACFAPAALSGLRPGCAAQLGLAYRHQAVDYAALAPLYLRAPQAERERAEKADKEARHG